MKKVISLITMILLFTAALMPAAAAAGHYGIQYAAEKSAAIVKGPQAPNISRIAFAVSGDLRRGEELKATISLIIDGGVLTAEALGCLNQYDNGCAGVFDGYVEINGRAERITLDLMYQNKNENFTAVTIGCAGDEEQQILFFGELSPAIGKLSEAHIQASHAAMKDSGYEAAATANAVDTTNRYQATNTKNASGYPVASISLYHANELKSRSSMLTYAKVNSHTAQFRDYLINEKGFGTWASSLLVNPDSYEVEIAAANKYLHHTGSAVPANNASSVNLTYSAYIPGAGSRTLGVPLNLTSARVSYRGVSSGAVYDNNIVNWKVFKTIGWNPDMMDGYYSNAAGGSVRAYYRFDSSVATDTLCTMKAYGAVRYQYIYSPFGGEKITLHMWTGDASCSSRVTIVP